MPETLHCPDCGAALTPGQAQALCPRCALKGALELSNEDTEVVSPLPPAPEVGERIGRYKLLEKIGEGGCGVVYMAEQEEPVRRRVALKVIKPGMDTREVIARFEAERQALALMEHSHIAKVFDAGATDAGRPYFVMELVRGLRITDYCDQKNLSTRQRLDLFMQVCQAVQHAHQKGVIHRDLKPSNILVTVNDGVPVPKVIDFGIAKATGQSLTDKTFFTKFQQLIGTPAYMSPEQAEMTSVDIDTRSDIYSLGVLLYELLTGRTPFDAKKLLRVGMEEMLRTIREQEPARPSARLSTLTAIEQTTVARQRQTDAPKLVNLVRGDLDWIVMKCLEKDRARRYETANGLAMDLQRHLDQEPVLARAPTAAYRVQKFVTRNKGLVGATTVVALVLILSAGISSWQWREAVMARNTAELQRQKTQEKALAEELAKDEAQRERLNAQQSLYNSDILLAQQALAESNLGRARELVYRHWPKPGEPDLRGWEWRYLWKQCQGDELATFQGHEKRVHGTAFSPDGQFLVSLSVDGSCRLWSLTSFHEIARSGCLMDYFNGLAFSGDSKRLFTTGITEPFARIWEMPAFKWNGRLKHSHGYSEGGSQDFNAVKSWLGPMALSPDGRLLASMNSVGVVLWDAKSLSELPSAIPIQTAQNGRIAFTADSRRIVFNAQNAVHLWDLADQKIVASVGQTSHAWTLAPDGTTLVLSRGDNIIRVLDVMFGTELRQMTNHLGPVNAFAFSPDGQVMASAGRDQTVRLWETGVWEETRVLRGHLAEVLHVAFSPDGAVLASCGEDTTIRLWRVTTRKDSSPDLAIPAGLNSILSTHDGRKLMFLRGDGVFTLADTERREHAVTNTLPYPLPDVERMALSPGGELLAIAMKSGSVRMLNLQTMREEKPFPRRDTENQLLIFSTDGKSLITFSRMSAGLRVWDISARQQVVEEHVDDNGNVTCVRPSPDASQIAIGYKRGKIDLWDGRSRERKTLVPAHKYDVRDAVFSPNSNRLITAGSDGTVKVWDLATTKLIVTFSGTLGAVNSLAVSPDGRLLAGGTEDGHVKLWDLNLRQEVATFRGQRGAVRRVGFYSDGETLIAVGHALVTAWHAPSFIEIELSRQPKTNLVALIGAAVNSPTALAAKGTSNAARSDPRTTQARYVSDSSLSERALNIPNAYSARKLLAELDAALQRQPANATLWCARGALLHRMGDRDGALFQFSRSIALTSTNGETETFTNALIRRSALLRELNRGAEAGQDERRAIGLPTMSSHLPDYQSAAEVSMEFGRTNRESGLYFLHGSGNGHEIAVTNGEESWFFNAGLNYAYFYVDPTFKWTLGSNVVVRLDYRVVENGPPGLFYNGTRDAYTFANKTRRPSVGNWQVVEFILHDAHFRNGQNGHADFRIWDNVAGFHLKRVTVSAHK